MESPASTPTTSKKPSTSGWSSIQPTRSKLEADAIPSAPMRRPRRSAADGPPRRCKSSDTLTLGGLDDDDTTPSDQHDTRLRRQVGDRGGADRKGTGAGVAAAVAGKMKKPPTKAKSFNAAADGIWSTQTFGDIVQGPGLKRIGKAVEPIELRAHLANGKPGSGMETASSRQPEAFHGISRKPAVTAKPNARETTV
jgi:hypothetical protein